MKQTSHSAIFKSSAWVAILQAVRMAVGLVQAKCIALVLGTAGTGAFGIYASLQTIAQEIFGLGVGGSGVRQMGVASAGGGRLSAARLSSFLQRVGVVLGLAGAIVLVLGGRWISVWTFGDERHATGVAFIGLALVPATLASTQFAVLQGLRRIRDFAIANAIGAVGGAMAAILLVVAWREAGIAPAFAAVAACSLLGSWWMCRRVPSEPHGLGAAEAGREFRELVALGAGFLAPSLLAAFSAYVIRLVVRQGGGLQDAGLFQAAWMLTTVYANVVLQAMGTDFLPRLSTAAREPTRMNELVNEQTEVGLVLVMPGLALCLVFAPWVFRVLYTPEFLAATDCARWMILGMMIRAVAWPCAYIPLALARPRLTVLTETLFNLALIGGTAAGSHWLGFTGVGIGFFATGILYTGVTLLLARRLTGFRSTPRSRSQAWILYALVAVEAGLLLAMPAGAGNGAAAVLAVAVCLYCAWRMVFFLGGTRFICKRTKA